MRPAFTMIELLVVITIIALLAGLLIPSLGIVRDQATRATCLSNLRQCSLAIWGYSGENEGLIPLTGDCNTNVDAVRGPDANLLVVLDSYMGNWRTWGCPAVRNVIPVNDLVRNSNSVIRTNYQYWAGTIYNGKTICPTSVQAIRATTLVMQDFIYLYQPVNSWRSNHGLNGTVYKPYPTNPSLCTNADMADPRGMNTIFGDLHGSWTQNRPGTTTTGIYATASWYPAPTECKP